MSDSYRYYGYYGKYYRYYKVQRRKRAREMKHPPLEVTPDESNPSRDRRERWRLR